MSKQSKQSAAIGREIAKHNAEKGPIEVTSWNSIPPVVWCFPEAENAVSLRVLESNYREMYELLKVIANQQTADFDFNALDDLLSKIEGQ